MESDSDVIPLEELTPVPKKKKAVRMPKAKKSESKTEDKLKTTPDPLVLWSELNKLRYDLQQILDKYEQSYLKVETSNWPVTESH